MADERDRGTEAPWGDPPPPQPGWGPPQQGSGWGPPQQGYGPPPGYGAPGYGPPGAPGPYGWAPPGPGYPLGPKNSERAVWVLATGAGSLVALFTCLLGFIPAIVSLCLAPGARREIRDSAGRLTGDGLIKAGVICSWVTIGLTVLGVILVVAFFASVATFSWTVDSVEIGPWSSN